jgi:4-hydroxy-tetrahydrodipicolinate synthase
MARLAKDQENIVAIKEATGNISQVAKLANLTDGMIDIYSGNDDQIVPLCSLGGVGVISVLANVAPRQTHDLVMYCLEGNYEEARKLQLRALPLIEQLFIEVNPIPVKAALNMQGFEVGIPRLPLTEMTRAHQETLRKAMEEFGCL